MAVLMHNRLNLWLFLCAFFLYSLDRNVENRNTLHYSSLYTVGPYTNKIQFTLHPRATETNKYALNKKMI